MKSRESRAVPASVVKLAPLAILVVGAAIVYSRRSAELRRLPVFEFACELTDGPEPPTILASFSLGRVSGRTITGHIQQTGDSVALLFIVRDARGNRSVLTFEGGSGVKLEVKAADCIGTSRRQVLLSVKSETDAAIWLLDCDGTQIRTIYSSESGDDCGAFAAESVRLIRAKGSTTRWRLEEERRWEAGKEIGDWGLCYELQNAAASEGDLADEAIDSATANVSFVRFLHWNGEAFLPNDPGPTRLVSMTAKDFDTQFH